MPGESIKAYKAFTIYRNLDPNERSLQRVVSELRKSRAHIERWSVHWSWAERAQAWDNYQELRRLERQIGAKQKMDEDHMQILRAMRSRAISVLRDLCAEGDALWRRFTGSKEETIWYYRALVDAFRAAGGLEDLVGELDEVVGCIEELAAATESDMEASLWATMIRSGGWAAPIPLTHAESREDKMGHVGPPTLIRHKEVALGTQADDGGAPRVERARSRA
jgi:hypothetical protein